MIFTGNILIYIFTPVTMSINFWDKTNYQNPGEFLNSINIPGSLFTSKTNVAGVYQNDSILNNCYVTRSHQNKGNIMR